MPDLEKDIIKWNFIFVPPLLVIIWLLLAGLVTAWAFRLIKNIHDLPLVEFTRIILSEFRF